MLAINDLIFASDYSENNTKTEEPDAIRLITPKIYIYIYIFTTSIMELLYSCAIYTELVNLTLFGVFVVLIQGMAAYILGEEGCLGDLVQTPKKMSFFRFRLSLISHMAQKKGSSSSWG